MSRMRHPGACSIYMPTHHCPNCGTRYEKQAHPDYEQVTYWNCPECSTPPTHYKVGKTLNGHFTEFEYNRKGHRIKTLEDAYKLSLDVADEWMKGKFKKSNYKRKGRVCALSDTISDFFEIHIKPRVRRLKITQEDLQWAEEYMVPYMADVGVFTVSEIHLMDFIRTFRLKGEDQERARRFFKVLVKEIRI